MPAKKTISEHLRGQERFGHLRVLGEAEPRFNAKGDRITYVALQCDCGNLTTSLPGNLRDGRMVSCGCARTERLRQRSLTHGAKAGGVVRPEYHTWQHMLQRCHNEKNKNWPHYGGRGITVCDEWRVSFDTFLAHIGPRPSPEHSIDRIDNDAGYKPGNVRWATSSEQHLNMRTTNWIVLDDERLLAADACARADINYESVKVIAARETAGQRRVQRLPGWQETPAVKQVVKVRLANAGAGVTIDLGAQRNLDHHRLLPLHRHFPVPGRGHARPTPRA